MSETPRCYRHPDRETLVSCSECGRPICEECMTFAPVGIRCPEHSGKPVGTQRVTQGVRRASFEGTGAIVTKILVATNVAIYLLELGLGGTVDGRGNRIYEEGALYGPLVANGDWWRVLTAAFLHYGPIHLGLNMFALWFFGSAVETAIGRGRYLLLYVVSGIAGSAGALVFTPNSVTVGASGAIFGILGAALVLEHQRNYVLGGGAIGIIVLNLVFTFAIPGISIGGHLGGLVGGALAALALERFASMRVPKAVPIVACAALGLACAAAAVAVADSKAQQFITAAAALFT
jgi:membrane associated rhomboid family serine protease